VALDAEDAKNIVVRGEFELPGSIQDSRRVGDVLYLVTHEQGGCWGCKDLPNTTITSLDISDTATPEIIDQVTFESDQDSYWSGQRSVSSTNERMYVAGPEYGEAETDHSIIEVVDISDPTGRMAKGASVSVNGQIQNRWQMDEYEGVLRVVSQSWDTSLAPVVETFAIASSNQLTPVGSLAMTLPRPEQLQSVRFDGLRAYAITFEQTDPLFTLDLSDPANPKQTGELELPGWVYHMEPRGERVLGLGFDATNAEGALNVSLFDVSDMMAPKLLQRVHFGGDWASFAEDQDRIHKAFTVLEQDKLMLVPFSGWSYDEIDGPCSGAYHSAVQLIDFDALTDTLMLRGQARARGESRRGFLHDGRLFSVSDKAIQTFDITNRDAPVQTAHLPIASRINRTKVAGEHLLRVAMDWWTNDIELEIVPIGDPERPDALGRLVLDPIVQADDPGQEGSCYGGWYDAEIFAADGYAYIVHDVYTWNDVDDYQGTTRIAVIDLFDPTEPKHVNTITLPFVRGYYSGARYFGDLSLPSATTVLINNRIVMDRRKDQYESDKWIGNAAYVDVVDLTDPEQPELVASLKRPDAMQHGGLTKLGGEVVTWHVKAFNADASQVAFFLQTLDLQLAEPELGTAVNVPGVPISYDAAARRVVTVDFDMQSVAAPTWEACGEHVRAYQFDEERGQCVLMHHELKLVELFDDSARLLDSFDVDAERRFQFAMGSGATVYAMVSDRNGWGWGWVADGDDASEVETYTPPAYDLFVIAGAKGDELSVAGKLELGAEGLDWWSMQAFEDKLVAPSYNGLRVVNTSNPAQPSLTVHELYGYGCQSLEIENDTAYCSLGEWGLQTIALQ